MGLGSSCSLWAGFWAKSCGLVEFLKGKDMSALGLVVVISCELVLFSC